MAKRRRWLWGTIATWATQRHIAKEIKLATEAMSGATRDMAMQVMRDRIEFHFDKAWPVRRKLADETSGEVNMADPLTDGDKPGEWQAAKLKPVVVDHAKDKRIAELEAFVKDLMTAHGPGTLASEELYARGVKLIEK